MSRSITSQILDEYKAGELFPYFLLQFSDGSNVYRYTSLDVPQFFTGTGSPSGMFEPRGFQFDSVTYSMGQIVDDAVIRIDNLDQVCTSIFVGGTMQGQPASIYTGVLTASGGNIGSVLFFEGQIDSFELDEQELRLMIGSPFSKWSHKATGKHSSSCRWKVFKGTECQYSGAETICDRSYARCSALGNTAHFGGFRFLPDLENKVLWWGPTPTQMR